jgi:ATP-dependent helicase/nuclease subunit B
MFYPISPNTTLADAVADHVMAHWPRAQWDGGIVFVPDAASVATVRAALMQRAAEKSVRLPRMVALANPLEDAQAIVASLEVPPIMPPLMRDWLVSEQILAFFRSRGQSCDRSHALRLAKSLGELLDDCERYGIDRHAALASGGREFSRHWQEYSLFLGIVLTHWPEIEAAHGMLSPALAIHRALSTIAAQWEAIPPAFPVLAAGSSGTHPATARLLRVIAQAEQGAVLLPGILPGMEVNYEAAIAAGHPLYHIKNILEGSAKTLAQLSAELPDDARAQWIAQVFRPSELASIPAPEPQMIHTLEAAHEHEEARAIALLVHDGLERDADAQVAVISADMELLQRVAGQMARFGIVADTTHLQRMRDTAFHGWLALLLQVALSNARPLAVLAWLQHPLTRASEEALRTCDISYARGIVKETGWPTLTRKMTAIPDEPWKTCLTSLFTVARERLTLAGWRDALEKCAQILEIVEVLEAFTALDEVVVDKVLGMSEFAALWRAAGNTPVGAPMIDMHPRVTLASPEKARLLCADRVIIAGLNEGTWPPLRNQAWLNRAMRKKIGLPLAEHALSISAEDFALSLQAREVFLTRAKQEGGSMTSASRFWLRVNAASAASLSSEIAQRILQEARTLDNAMQSNPEQPPAPNPPVSTRPRALSVTQVEALIHNPYAIYAQEILKLAPLHAIEEEPDARLFGTLAHRVLEKLQADSDLDELITQALRPFNANPKVAALWHMRLRRIVDFFVVTQAMRQTQLSEFWGEQTLTLSLPLSQGMLALEGRADRIEQMRDGSYGFIDFKTGSENLSRKRFLAGELPQLPLYAAAWMERRGEAMTDAEFAYWKLPQGAREGEISTMGTTPPETISAILERIRVFADQLLCTQTPMLYAPHGMSKYADYEALARVGESL